MPGRERHDDRHLYLQKLIEHDFDARRRRKVDSAALADDPRWASIVARDKAARVATTDARSSGSTRRWRDTDTVPLPAQFAGVRG